MFYTEQRRQVLSHSIMALWRNWTLGLGAIVLLIISAPFLPPKLVPVVAVLLEFALLALDKQNRVHHSPSCFRIPHIVETILFITAILLVIVIFYTGQEGATEFIGQPVNPTNKQIPILVTAPVTMLVTLYFLIRRHKSAYCSACLRRNGHETERGILGIINNRESTFQIILLFVLTTLLTVLEWGYYFIYYINININASDRFFFIFIPVIMYLLSVIYIFIRCYNIRIYYCMNEGMARYISRSGTVVRYLIMDDERILLGTPDMTRKPDKLNPDDLRIDSPVKVVMPYREKVTTHEARTYFADASGIREFEIKPLYESHDPGMFNNMFHYAVFLKHADPQNPEVPEKIQGSWFTLREVTEMIKAGMIAPALSSEIQRIYTVTMAFKTYDNRGFRLYDIKHYKPSFRLKDVRKSDIDYNDPNWLYISSMNQDKHFFRLRRLFNFLNND